MAGEATVIVGASIGGVRTAQALRAADYTGLITLLSDETVLPYDKPPLSKGLLAGTTTVEDVGLLARADADKLGIDLRLGQRAVSLHVADNEVELHTGQRLAYQHLVIATGARARPSPWGQPDGLHVLRTLADSQALRADLEPGRRLVVIGGGFIGAETAATARSLGVAVTIVDPSPVPMERILGRRIGERFTRLHQHHGVQTLFGIGVHDVTGQRGHFQVHLSDGRTLAADTVVVGIGAIPNDEWLASSGLVIDSGIVCDQYCRATNTTNIFAVGDVARWHHPRRGQLTRVEHWTNAIEQATAVAHNITHTGEDLIAYAPVEYVWSDQYDWKIRMAGLAWIDETTAVEVVGDDIDTGRFAGLYSHGGHTLDGIVVVNWPRALVAGRKALAESTPYPMFKQVLEQLTASPKNATAGARP